MIPNDILRTMAKGRGGVSNSSSFTWAGNVIVNPPAGMTAVQARQTGAQIGAAAAREMALYRRRGY